VQGQRSQRGAQFVGKAVGHFPLVAHGGGPARAQAVDGGDHALELALRRCLQALGVVNVHAAHLRA